MNPTATPRRRHLALGLISAALLADQIVLMQLFATSQWHHFAYLVISVALLGFGAAGSLLAIARDRLLQRQAFLLPLLLSGCALTMTAPLGLAQALFGGFDSYLMFVSAGEALKLAGVALLLMLPFGFGALVIGIIFTTDTERIGSHYAANLLGSGLGCLLGLFGLERLPPEVLPAFCALLSIAAAIILVKKHQVSAWLGILPTLLVVGMTLWHPPAVNLSQYKDLQRTIVLPEAKIIGHAPSASGQVHLVEAPALRYAPAGVSLKWRGIAPHRPMVFVNGNLAGAVPPLNDSPDPMMATTSALPYAITSPERILILGAGTGVTVNHALLNKAAKITAVEPNHRMTELLQNSEQAFQQLRQDPRVTWHTHSAWTWLNSDSQIYDLIILPTVGTVGGDAGLFALQEQPLLTREALFEAWQHLAPDGFLALTSWVDYPVRSPLRLLSTTLAALADAGVTEPAQQIAAIRSWGTITFCIKRTPLVENEVIATLRFAERWGFDPLLLPDLPAEKREANNRLQDDSLMELVDTLLSEKSAQLIRTYPFRIDPPTNDRPFFSQFLRWGHLNELIALYGSRAMPFLEIGLLVAIVAALILTGLAILLILTPLLCLPRRSGRKGRTLLYFGGLGIGYIGVEMTLVHRFTLYLDHPVPAAALVISALLIGSGCGSLLSIRFSPAQAGRWALGVASGITGYAVLLGLILDTTEPLPSFARMVLAGILIMPLAILMGLPFPLGLRRLDEVFPAEVPWAWGINGCLSVVGAALATLVAVEFGFTALLLLAAASYLLPASARLVGSRSNASS
jgi:hypothetical protein